MIRCYSNAKTTFLWSATSAVTSTLAICLVEKSTAWDLRSSQTTICTSATTKMIGLRAMGSIIGLLLLCSRVNLLQESATETAHGITRKGTCTKGRTRTIRSLGREYTGGTTVPNTKGVSQTITDTAMDRWSGLMDEFTREYGPTESKMLRNCQ